MRNHKNQNELELLEAAISGDNDAFGKLIAPYIPRLKRFIGRLVYSPENTDDVLQLTMLQAWQGLDSFEGRSQLSTWLYRIAKNAALTFLGRRSKLTSREIPISGLSAEGDADWDGLVQAGHLDTPDGKLEEKQLLARLIKVEARLPAELAETYRLRYFGELSYQEIAQQLGVPIGTVRSRINRARTALDQLPRRKRNRGL